MCRIHARALLRAAVVVAAAAFLAVGLPALAQDKPAAANKAKAGAFDASACYGCHRPIKDLHGAGQAQDASAATRATTARRSIWRMRRRGRRTKTDLANCGACHQNQYKSYAQMNWHRTRALREEAVRRPRAGPRLRPADDAARFHEGAQPAALAHVRAARPVRRRPRVRRPLRARRKAGATSREPATSTCGTWSSTSIPTTPTRRLQARHGGRRECRVPVLQDAGPHPRMGVHGRSGARRQVEPHVEGRRAGEGVNHALNCIFCHDPHAAKPRIVRDALIQALTRTEAPTLYSQDPNARPRSTSRTWACAASRARSRCWNATTASCSAAQCHVEYNCNPGFNPTTGEADRDGGPADQLFPVRRREQHPQGLRRDRVPRFPQPVHRRGAVEGAASRRRDVLQLEARQGGHRLHVVPHAEGQGREDGQVLHVALADQPEELPQGDLPAVPPQWDETAGALRDRIDGMRIPGQGAQCRVLAVAAHRQVRRRRSWSASGKTR